MGGGKFMENKYIQRLGELSFTIFLTHQLILRYTTLIFNRLRIDDTIIYVILTLVLTILVSIIVEQFIIKPITQWLTKRIQPSMIVRS